MRLLTALNQFKLEVPAWILKLEGELKKEWEGENRKLKKAAAGGTKTKAAKTADLAGVGRQTLPSGQGIEVNGRFGGETTVCGVTADMHS